MYSASENGMQHLLKNLLQIFTFAMKIQFSISYLYCIPFVYARAPVCVCFWVALKYCHNPLWKFHYVQLGSE